MYKLFFVALFCVQALARPNEDLGIESHIVGGSPASEGQYPFIVSIRDASGFFCGGALVSNKHVVTAAHCIVGKSASGVRIGAGSVNLASQKVFAVDRIIAHPGFNGNNKLFPNDIAILRLQQAVPLGGNIQTIDFPTNDNLDNRPVTALGWGYVSAQGPISQRLLYLNRQILPNSACSSRLGANIGAGQVCLGGEVNYGMCFGDSGSPLAYRGNDGKTYLAGVVSWGIPCAKGYPDVFTRVSYFASWIRQNMN